MNQISPDQAGKLLDGLTELVSRAAAATLATPFSEVARQVKSDGTPVTTADVASEAIIVDGLARLLPGIPVIAEESAARAPAQRGASVVLVDPLDGTKEFLAGRDEFTVNLALVSGGVAIAGVIAAPKRGLLWRGAVGGKAERLRAAWGEGAGRVSARDVIHTRPAPERLVAAVSRSHLDAATEEYLSRLTLASRHPCGSSMKFCHIAEGAADIYPRLSPTSEWDIAAGCAILTAAGGVVSDLAGNPLRFGQGGETFLVPGFIAWGDPAKATPR